jgi:hypothetical protein
VIDGEHGNAIIEGILVLQAADLADSDTISTQLFSALIAQALRSEQTPREVAVSLWDGLPSDDDWENVVREKFEQAIEELEQRGL